MTYRHDIHTYIQLICNNYFVHVGSTQVPTGLPAGKFTKKIIVETQTNKEANTQFYYFGNRPQLFLFKGHTAKQELHHTNV